MTEPTDRFTFTIGPKAIAWLAGIVGVILAGVVSWFAIWDRIDTHWRLETIQTAKDKETDLKLKTLAQKAETGRAWLFWGLADFKAEFRESLVDACHDQRAKSCAKLETSATQARLEATDAKRSAMDSGKEH